ncbi:MAG: N-acetyltransferase family protein [Phycisphaerales bacterium]|nr:N-acetyltransferase family protein [Phycisphaerales bacterium]
MHIRLAKREDVGAIVVISNWAAEHTSANFAIEPETPESWLASWEQTHRMYPWLVCEGSDRRVIGFAKGSPHRSRCAYAWSAEVSVYVDPGHHGKGAGTALYARLIELLKAQGYVTLLAGITSPNPASEKLHEAFGFRRVGCFERVGWKFDRWHDVGYWELILQEGDGVPGELRSVDEVIR